MTKQYDDFFEKYESKFDDLEIEDFLLLKKDNKEYWDEEGILQYFLNKEIVFINQRRYLHPECLETGGETIVLFVNISDTFGYSCADGEDITRKDLPILFKLYKEYGYLGVVKWASKKRKRKPIKEYIEMLKEEELWEEDMDNY